MDSFIQGYRLGQSDLLLNLFARYNYSQPDVSFPYTPYWIRYDLGFIHPITSVFMPIGAINRLPEIIDTGKVRPNFIVGENWKPGVYEIRWYYKAMEDSTAQLTIVQFSITSSGMRQENLLPVNHVDVCAYMILY